MHHRAAPFAGESSPWFSRRYNNDNALIEFRDPLESDLRRWFWQFLFFLARNTPLHGMMTKMLSVKTAERGHVPAATSIQIYSVSLQLAFNSLSLFRSSTNWNRSPLPTRRNEENNVAFEQLSHYHSPPIGAEIRKVEILKKKKNEASKKKGRICRRTDRNRDVAFSLESWRRIKDPRIMEVDTVSRVGATFHGIVYRYRVIYRRDTVYAP